jgi:hypothetical protein
MAVEPEAQRAGPRVAVGEAVPGRPQGLRLTDTTREASGLVGRARHRRPAAHQAGLPASQTHRRAWGLEVRAALTCRDTACRRLVKYRPDTARYREAA